jgi:hypothetical protein
MSKALPFLSPVLALAGAFKKKPAAQKPVYAQPTATPRSNSVVANALAGRRGTIENQRTGAGGVESSTGKKTALGG